MTHTRILFIALVATAAAGHTMLVAAQNLPLPPLKYAYDALEPHLDAENLRVHHQKHHQSYTNSLNDALAALRSDAATKHLAKMGIDKLLQHLEEVPESYRNMIRNAGGGYVNHAFFFDSMSPAGGGTPSTALLQALETAFESFEGFQMAFSQAAVRVFGSGWVWLCLDTNDRSLHIQSTANQDTPASHPNMVPLLNLDVWEHAYYLKYRNDRVSFIQNWWSVVDWTEVEHRYIKALEQ